MFILVLYSLLSFTEVVTQNVEVLNYTYVEYANESLSVYNFSNGQSTSKSFTICTWAKSVVEQPYLFSLQEDYKLRKGNDVYLSNYIYFSFLGGDVFDRNFESNTSCPLQNIWIHVCFRIQGQEVVIFLYGLPLEVIYEDEATNETEYPLNSVISIGSYFYNNDRRYDEQFAGQLYQYNVWKKGLSDAEIKNLAKCPAPKKEGDLVTWSKIINGIKNGDEDLTAHYRVTALEDEGPCRNYISLDCLGIDGGIPGSGSDQSGNSDSGTSSGGMNDQGSSSDQSGNSDLGTSSGGMNDQGSSSDQSGNSDPGTSSGGMKDQGSSSDQSGNSDPGTSSGVMNDQGLRSGQSGNSDPGTSSGVMNDQGSRSGQSGKSDPGTSSGVMNDQGSSSDQSGNSKPRSSSSIN